MPGQVAQTTDKIFNGLKKNDTGFGQKNNLSQTSWTNLPVENAKYPELCKLLFRAMA